MNLRISCTRLYVQAFTWKISRHVIWYLYGVSLRGQYIHASINCHTAYVAYNQPCRCMTMKYGCIPCMMHNWCSFCPPSQWGNIIMKQMLYISDIDIRHLYTNVIATCLAILINNEKRKYHSSKCTWVLYKYSQLRYIGRSDKVGQQDANTY